MKIGRIEGVLIGQERSIEEWVITIKATACGMCDKEIPAVTLAYRQTILEGRRFSRSYAYCRHCAEETGRKPPQNALEREERARRAKNEKERRNSLFPIC